MWNPILSNMATLKEMQTYYTMDDLADMLEALALKSEIEHRAMKKSQSKSH
jgi:hypothetical protein